MKKQKRYIVVMDVMENDHPATFYLCRPSSPGFHMGYTCARVGAAEFTKAEAGKQAARFKRPHRQTRLEEVEE